MPEATGLETLLVPIRVVAFVVAALAAVWLASRLARRFGLDPAWSRNVAAGTVVIGLVAARLAHVALHWQAYAPDPWKALYLWQPGYLPLAGVAAGIAYLLFRLRSRDPQQRLTSLRAVTGGLAAGAVILAAVIGGVRWWDDASVLRAGDRLPDFELVDLVGESVSSVDIEGRGAVLNFWATWCPPCRREMPLLQSAWDEYRTRDIVVVGIAVGQTRGEVQPFVDSMGVGYPIWLEPPSVPGDAPDTWDILGWFGSAGLPTTVFVGPDGVIRDVRLGELNRSILMEHLPDMAP